jgi:hypothetical protein
MKKIMDILMEGEGGGGGGGTPPPAPATFETIIPEEFKDRAYLNDLKTLPVGAEGYNALFKKLDGAQTLIGKKTGIPAPDAPEEEWEKFHSALRPAKAEEYEIAGADEESALAVKNIFHEAGLSKAQAAKLAAKFDAYVGEKTKAQREEAEKLDAEFEGLAKNAFGADTEKVLARSKEMIQQLTPASMAPFLNRLPNESLVLLAGVMETVRAKFMKEDNMGGGAGAGGSAVDVSALRSEAQTLQSSEAWKNPWHKDHEKTVARVNEIYNSVSRASGGKK